MKKPLTKIRVRVTRTSRSTWTAKALRRRETEYSHLGHAHAAALCAASVFGVQPDQVEVVEWDHIGGGALDVSESVNCIFALKGKEGA